MSKRAKDDYRAMLRDGRSGSRGGAHPKEWTETAVADLGGRGTRTFSFAEVFDKLVARDPALKPKLLELDSSGRSAATKAFAEMYGESFRAAALKERKRCRGIIAVWTGAGGKHGDPELTALLDDPEMTSGRVAKQILSRQPRPTGIRAETAPLTEDQVARLLRASGRDPDSVA